MHYDAVTCDGGVNWCAAMRTAHSRPLSSNDDLLHWWKVWSTCWSGSMPTCLSRDERRD